MNNNLLKYLNYLKSHIINELNSNNKDCYIIGVSCGIDSVLSLRILLDTFESSKIHAYFIDIDSDQDKFYLETIINYFNNFDLKIKKVNLLDSFKAIKD
ncbi:MAG: hypothetical protein K2L64_02385, partial [Ureaplasma sp.]|nr:hypothetical protein [Ureaplasma sp.]